MSNEELSRTIAALRSVTADLITSKEKALAFLVKAGISTPTGELTEHYKPRA